MFKQIKEPEQIWSIIELVGGYKLCDDKEFCEKVFRKFLKINGDYLYEIANHIRVIASPKGLNNPTWARELYEKVLDQLQDSEDSDTLLSIASDIALEDGLSDTQWATNIIIDIINQKNYKWEFPLVELSNNNPLWVLEIYKLILDNTNSIKNIKPMLFHYNMYKKRELGIQLLSHKIDSCKGKKNLQEYKNLLDIFTEYTAILYKQ